MKKENAIFLMKAIKTGDSLILEKSIEGGGKKFYMHGVTSDTSIDLEGDSLSEEFLKKASGEIVGMTVFYEHSHSIEDTIGFISEAEYNSVKKELHIEVELENPEDNAHVERILKKSKNKIKIGFSVFGSIENAIVKISDKGKPYRQIIDGNIYEVSATAFPANRNAVASVISKSLDDYFKKKDGNISNEKIEKGLLLDKLQERILRDAMHNLYYAYSDMLYDVIHSNYLSNEEKTTIVNSIAEEFVMLFYSFISELNS
jgi:hypothetical protein